MQVLPCGFFCVYILKEANRGQDHLANKCKRWERGAGVGGGVSYSALLTCSRQVC